MSGKNVNQSFEQTLKYRDECGTMAAALIDTRKVLGEMAAKLQNISSALASRSQNLSTTTDENVNTITQVAAAVSEIAEGNNEQAKTINEITVTLSEVVQLIDKITKDTLRGAENAVKSLDIVKEGQSAVETYVEKIKENISASHEANKSIDELSKMIE